MTNPKPSQWAAVARTLYLTYGARGLALRARHEVRRRLGCFRAKPRADAGGVGGRPLFKIDPARFEAAEWRHAGMARAERVLAGEHQAFRCRWTPLPTTASDWVRHPVTGMAFPIVPWWKVPTLSPQLGDIKGVWEAGRFGWGYDLIRGYLVTSDERYVEAFFDNLASWSEGSPPFQGPHWACGQETAIRAVTLVYADSVFGKAAGATPVRLKLLRDILGWSGERIRDGIGFAVSQRNNHGISEAVGLVVLGSRLEGGHPEAAAWQRYGTHLLERLITEQFAVDGWYVQHSFTYLRLALDQCVVAQRALADRGKSLSAAVIGRLRAAGNLLAAVIDPSSGEMPNHGPNDGALVHPICSAGVRDFRPLCTALAATFGFPLPGGVRPDQETLAWLGAAVPPCTAPAGDGVTSGPSGWAAARLGPFRLFFRAGRYRSRPGHADGLHLDLRLSGHELLVDPGTYSYNAPDPWRNGLTGAAVHNGPLVNDGGPGLRGPRFLWYLWPESDLTAAKLAGGTLILSGQIADRVRRTIVATEDQVTVTDTALAPDSRSLAVSWLLRPGANPDLVEIDGDTRTVPAVEGAVAGWYSPAYGERIASASLVSRREGGPGTTITTRVRAGRACQG